MIAWHCSWQAPREGERGEEGKKYGRLHAEFELRLYRLNVFGCCGGVDLMAAAVVATRPTTVVVTIGRVLYLGTTRTEYILRCHRR